MISRRHAIQKATEKLSAIDDARRNAEWLLAHVLGLRRAELLLNQEIVLDESQEQALDQLVARRMNREPLQYIIGYTDFFALRIKVGPGVLIPRPETEELVEEALKRLHEFDAPWILDVGTGSGAIALALKKERADAEVFACDVSADALKIARMNAEELNLPVTFIHSDALAPAFADNVPACFDMLISNPPYVPLADRETMQPEVASFEPEVALFPGDDPLLFYRALAGHAERLLKTGGILLVEGHIDYVDQAAELFRDAGLTSVEVLDDFSGRPRFAVGVKAGASRG